MIEQIYKWNEIAKPSWGVDDITEEGKVLAISLITEELSELKEAFETNNTKEITDAGVDLIWVTMSAMISSGITIDDFKKYAKAVEISNFSKFCDNLEDVKDTIQMYAEGKHPDKIGAKIQATFEYNPLHGCYTILRRSDGKVLKSYKYIPAEEVLKTL